MPRCLLLRHSHTALRPAPVLNADAHLGGFSAGVVTHHAQHAIAAFVMRCLDSRLEQAVFCGSQRTCDVGANVSSAC